MDINIRKILPSENITDIKVDSKRLAKDIRNGTRKSHKARSARNIARKNFSKSLKSGAQSAKVYFDYQKVLREFRIDVSNKIVRRLSELGLGKLINKNISESDLVKLGRLPILPDKTLKTIAELRNINTNLPKIEMLYALIRSEPVVGEEKYFIEGNDEIINKVSEARLLLLNQ